MNILIVHTPDISTEIKVLEAKQVPTKDGSHTDMLAPVDGSSQWGVYVFMSVYDTSMQYFDNVLSKMHFGDTSSVKYHQAIPINMNI